MQVPWSYRDVGGRGMEVSIRKEAVQMHWGMSQTGKREACSEWEPEVSMLAQCKQDLFGHHISLHGVVQDTCAHSTPKVVLMW